MHCLLQRNFYTSVKKTENGLMLAETKHADHQGETIARLLVDINTFTIEKAYLEIHQRVNGREEVKPVEGLSGIKAYFGVKRELKQAFEKMNEPLAAPLFAETIRGIIQAETYLLRERGFASIDDYSDYWQRMYRGSCRYYSNLDRADSSWGDYAGDVSRQGYVFLRFKTYFLYLTAPDQYLVIGSINDTFHEMNVSLTISRGRVLEAKGNMLRVPHDICCESTEFFAALAGTEIAPLSKKSISALLGGTQGCVHLVDMLDDSINTYRAHFQ